MEQLILALAPPAPPTLENFFPGPNRVALQALRGLVAGGPDRSVHLWGPVGSGRTHLLKATAAAFAAQGGSTAWIGPAAQHAALPRTAGSTMPAGPRIVICDDVDGLGSEAQLLAFEMIDEARREGSCILTSALHPAHELALRDDLRTRLAQSLSVSLASLSEDEKRAALAAHAAQRALHLKPEIIDYIISRVQRDMGSLTAVLEALDRYSLSCKRPLTVPLVREVLRRARY